MRSGERLAHPRRWRWPAVQSDISPSFRGRYCEVRNSNSTLAAPSGTPKLDNNVLMRQKRSFFRAAFVS